MRDFENDRAGWHRLSDATPYHIVKVPVASIRSGPGTRFRIVGKAKRYDLLRTRGATAGWIKVQSTEGIKGWVDKRLLWGW